jgi:alkylation response protein AidB-like acyl-CoA dehydrogenase
VNETDRSESVRMIRDSVGAIAPIAGDLQRIRALRGDARGVDRAVWQQVVDLGWLTLLLDEDRGGLGLGVRELTAIGEELGSALVPEPVTAVAAMVPLLKGSTRQSVLDGTRIVVPAWRETTSRLDARPQTAVQDGRVTGTKVLIAAAAAADAFVVGTEIGAVLVDRGADGVELALKRTQDGGQSGTLTLTEAVCSPIVGDFAATLEMLAMAHSGYLLGASERAFAMTLDYLGIREQFGRPIGSFQVLQHRAAEAKIQLAISRAVLDEAIADVERRGSAQDRVRSASRAIARVSDTAMLIAREAVQMHGAIGITDEHDIGLFCRKILTLYNAFGTASAKRSRYMATLQMEPVA